MADSGSEDERSPQINITCRTTTENHQVSVADNATIAKIKEILSQKINQPVDRICLIFSGKILKDHETLKTYNIKDGFAIHMVIRSAPSSGSNLPSRSTAASSGNATPTPAATTGNSTSDSFAGSIPGMPPGMNMETARRLMDSPLMQQMLNNPEILRNMIGGNQAIQSLIAQNPEIGHLLNDPDVLRQTMEMIRNPSMFNEMMRNHDQAIRNLQGIPGGEAALQRLYQDIQEPLLNSATSGSNPFATSNEANAESRSQRAGVENAEALPNPWGSSGGNTATRAPTGSDSTATTGGGLGGLGGMGNLSGMMNNPQMQDMMRSMMSNPQMQEMMRSMMSNPETIRSMLSPEMLQQARGLMGDNANIPNVEDISRMTEQISGLMSNPDIASALLNPRVLDAMNNIRTNIDIIRTEAPGLFQQMFQGVLSSMNNMQNPSNPSTTASQTTASSATDAAAGTGAQNPLLNPQFMNMLNALSGSNSAFGAASNIPPEERYRSQLDQLVSMGFSNREANIRALQEVNGDVNAAIDRLLNN